MNGYYVLLMQRDGIYKLYGIGDLPYMLELLEDYICVCKMYGNETGEFKIEKLERYLLNGNTIKS